MNKKPQQHHKHKQYGFDKPIPKVTPKEKKQLEEHFKHPQKKEKRLTKSVKLAIIIIIVFSIFVYGSYKSNNKVTVVEKTTDTVYDNFHSSSEDWDFLFQEEDIQKLIEKELAEVNKPNIPKNINGKDPTIAPPSVAQPFEPTTEDIIETIDPEPVVIDKDYCITPWGDKIKNGESIIAYQQRSDVNSLCDTERRLCKEGVLIGSFIQRNCKDNIEYEFSEEEVVSYNKRPTNPYIQPSDLAENRHAEFGTDGKLVKPEELTTTWNNNVNNPVVPTTSVGQTENINIYCITPWGNKVQNWHWTTAYKYANGFADAKCEVEIRFCNQWDLQGSYTHPNCLHHDVTYQDWIYGNTDPDAPTVIHMFETLMARDGDINKDEQAELFDMIDRLID